MARSLAMFSSWLQHLCTLNSFLCTAYPSAVAYLPIRQSKNVCATCSDRLGVATMNVASSILTSQTYPRPPIIGMVVSSICIQAARFRASSISSMEASRQFSATARAQLRMVFWQNVSPDMVSTVFTIMPAVVPPA